MEVDSENDGKVEVRGCTSQPRLPVEGGSNVFLDCPVFGSLRFQSRALFLYSILCYF